MKPTVKSFAAKSGAGALGQFISGKGVKQLETMITSKNAAGQAVDPMTNETRDALVFGFATGFQGLILALAKMD